MSKKPDDKPKDVFGDFAGWSGLNSATDPAAPNMTPEQLAAFEERQQATYDLNRSIHAALSTPDGQVLFNWLREFATEGARFSLDEIDPQRAAAIGFFREGQATFFFDLKNRMKAAEAGPPAVTNT